MSEEKQIRSKNDLFEGEIISEPPPALVVGYDEEEGSIYQCPKCGHRATSEGCDVMGAEPDCLFCLECSTEFKAW